MTEPNGVDESSTLLATEQRQVDAAIEIADLAELQAAMRHQQERIRHLEQALDESLLSLREVRSQLIDQNFLESHLAATEETANVQQQAILHLKQRLGTLQQALAEQSAGAGLPAPASLPEAGPHPPEQDHAQWPTAFGAQQQRMAVLEAESLSARVFAASLGVWLHQALTELRELTRQTSDPPPLFHQLEIRLQQALQQTQGTLHRLPGAGELEAEIAALPQTALMEMPMESPLPTQQEWAIAQAKLVDLETETARQISIHTLLQHANRELEQEREQQQARITTLERQTADLQEQILQQAQQSTEYQTAVQHWKDRYEAHRSQVQHLSELLTKALPEGNRAILDILASLQDSPEASLEPGSPELFVSSAQNQSTKLDLPDFLMRRRSYKTRRTS
jgi:hypothetical protein